MAIEINALRIENIQNVGWTYLIICKDLKDADDLFIMIGNPNDMVMDVGFHAIKKTLMVSIQNPITGLDLKMQTKMTLESNPELIHIREDRCNHLSTGHLYNESFRYNYPMKLVRPFPPMKWN